MAPTPPIETSALLRAVLPIAVAEGAAISACAAAFALTENMTWLWVGVGAAAVGSAVMIVRILRLRRTVAPKQIPLVENSR